VFHGPIGWVNTRKFLRVLFVLLFTYNIGPILPNFSKRILNCEEIMILSYLCTATRDGYKWGSQLITSV